MATRFMTAGPGTWSPERLARSRAVSAGAHSSGGADRTARLGRDCQPGHQYPVVHQPARGRMAPAHGVRKAWHQLSQGAAAGTARPRGGCRAGL